MEHLGALNCSSHLLPSALTLNITLQISEAAAGRDQEGHIIQPLARSAPSNPSPPVPTSTYRQPWMDATVNPPVCALKCRLRAACASDPQEAGLKRSMKRRSAVSS